MSLAEVIQEDRRIYVLLCLKESSGQLNEAVLRKHAATFKPLKLFTVQQYFGSLAEAQKVHFNDGGQFDKLYTPGK